MKRSILGAMKVELGQVISKAGRFLGLQREQPVYPVELSEQAGRVWIECNKWSTRIFRECGLDRLPEISADRICMKGMLRIGLAQVALNNNYHNVDDKKEARYGVGEALPSNVFLEIKGYYEAQKAKRTESLVDLMGIKKNPAAHANLIALQEGISREAAEIFQMFYGYWQLQGQSRRDVQERVISSLKILHLQELPIQPHK